MKGDRKVGVIGAGPCGLAVCKALGEFGLEYECLEAGERVGGLWNLDSHSSGAYRSLHTNTSTRAMAYADFPFSDDYPIYPSAARLQQYFEEYATHFELRPNIHLGQRVAEAHPLDGGGWRVVAEEGGEPREYSALIVATGQYVSPRWPTPAVPGTFAGDELHVFDYFDPVTPVDCRNKRVVVVGLGSSAAELAAELCDPDSDFGAADRVLLSARSGRWVVPKLIDGEPIDYRGAHPADPLPDELVALSRDERVALVRRLLKAGFDGIVEKTGTPESLGLPRPEIEPWEERPTMSMEFIPALRAGRIDVRPGIVGFEGNRVAFSDGSEAEADVILYATGYDLDFPFLSASTLGCDAPELSLYQQIAHARHDDLFFVGCLRVSCSMWPVAEQQSRWIARLLDGAFDLPLPAERQRLATSLARSLPVICNLYVDELRCEAGGL